jgi:hypothetical protein
MEVENNSLPYRDNLIIKDSTDDDTTYYTFRSPYEITINDCVIKNIITSGSAPIVQIDISGTDAQQTLSDFVTDIAATVGLDKQINISNIAVEFHLDDIIITLLENDDESTVIELLHTTPQLLHGHQVDIVIEWSSFFVKDADMGVNLALTQLTVADKILVPYQYHDVLKIIKDTSPKSISADRAPKLYKPLDHITIHYRIISLSLDI